VGCRSATITVNKQAGEMSVHWLCLPNVYHAAPMNVLSSGSRYALTPCITFAEQSLAFQAVRTPNLFQQ